MFHDEDNQGATILVSFLIGGIVGAGLALLLAPQSGRKTRKQISDMAEEVLDYTSDYAKKLKDKIA
ncbi:MAG TPA: YtxH domain-containing protein [Thermodesulfovibrionales bacterium]|nr:YtxH domain-containing protein [Thermodesulfovibrionales bacterium]